MKKKAFALCIALLLILPICFAVTASAEDAGLMILDCDNSFGTFQTERQNKTQGSACIRYDFNAGTDFASAKNFSTPIDGTGMTTLAVDVYVSDANLIGKMSQLMLELSSAGTCDQAEIAWALHTAARNLKAGWNTVYLYIDEGGYTDGTSGRFKLSEINYLRIYSYYKLNDVRGETLMFDNIRLLPDDSGRYDGINLDVYTGDSGNVDITIDGQSREEIFSDRDAGMTKAAGHKLKEDTDTPGGTEKGGCGAVIATGGTAMLAIALCASGVMLRRKK